MNRKKGFPKLFKKLGIYAFWLLVWQLLAVFFHNDILLVGPGKNASDLFFMSDHRWVLAFHLVFDFPHLHWIFSRHAVRHPDRSALLPLPDCRGISGTANSVYEIYPGRVICHLADLDRFENLSILISFLVAYPILHISTVSGLKSTDPKLLEMAQVFRVPFHKKVFYLYRPALSPYLISACKSALGMAFKSGIAAEVIGVPDFSIGANLYEAKIYLDTASLFAWTLAIILIASCFEKILLRLMTAVGGKGNTVHEKQ